MICGSFGERESRVESGQMPTSLWGPVDVTMVLRAEHVHERGEAAGGRGGAGALGRVRPRRGAGRGARAGGARGRVRRESRSPPEEARPRSPPLHPREGGRLHFAPRNYSFIWMRFTGLGSTEIYLCTDERMHSDEGRDAEGRGADINYNWT